MLKQQSCRRARFQNLESFRPCGIIHIEATNTTLVLKSMHRSISLSLRHVEVKVPESLLAKVERESRVLEAPDRRIRYRTIRHHWISGSHSSLRRMHVDIFKHRCLHHAHFRFIWNEKVACIKLLSILSISPINENISYMTICYLTRQRSDWLIDLARRVLLFNQTLRHP